MLQLRVKQEVQTELRTATDGDVRNGITPLRCGLSVAW